MSRGGWFIDLDAGVPWHDCKPVALTRHTIRDVHLDAMELAAKTIGDTVTLAWIVRTRKSPALRGWAAALWNRTLGLGPS